MLSIEDDPRIKNDVRALATDMEMSFRREFPFVIPPDIRDLVGLYLLVQNRPYIKTIVEIGAGYSTAILSHALADRPGSSVHSVETSETWAQAVQAYLQPFKSRSEVVMCPTTARASLCRGELAVFHDSLPDVTPDLIYLDGPDPANVQGDVAGLTFRNRVPVCADPLRYESTLLPKSLIIVDGRTTNVYFLQRNLRRKWAIITGDPTIFYLDDPLLKSQGG